jgi:hypothetical protein
VNAPPSVERCHCTDGAGRPLAAAVNVAASPAVTVWSCGCALTVGAAVTVSVAGCVVALPTLLVNTARNRCPSSAAVVGGVV